MKETQAKNFEYTGVDNLDVMSCAVNYNTHLADLITRNCGCKGLVLDFGAGIGTFSNMLRHRGFEVSCLEPDINMHKRLGGAGFQIYNSLDEVPANKFDLIIMLNVLEHIEDDRAILQELKSKLAPAGQIFIYVPAFGSLYSSMDKKVGHFRRYTKRSMIKLADQAGFNILKMRYADSIGFFASIAFKLVGNDSGDISTESIKKYDRWIFPLSALLDKVFGCMFGKNIYIAARPK